MSIAQDLNRLEGRRQQLLADKATTSADVSLSKARIAQKDAVRAFMEDIQTEAHRVTIDQYGNLLSEIVKDVMVTPVPITLEIYSERGLPALDVNAIIDGSPTSIFDDTGGSLNNVISMGLRLIAVVRSSNRKFVVLDEPDCWLRNEYSKNFFGVVKDMTDQMKDNNFQCVAVSHHHYSEFKEGANIIEFHLDNKGKPGQMLRARNIHKGLEWKDASQEGVRSVRMRNVQSHKDTYIELAPGLNIIAGDNNIGKTTFSRVFRYLRGKVSDNNIRRRTNRMDIDIVLENNLQLSFSRERGRTPVNLWELKEVGSNEPVIYKGQRCSMGGKDAPDWVMEVLKMPMVEDLDIHISNQMSPVFLLNEKPSTRAVVLSIGQESNFIRDMIILHKDAVASDSLVIRNGEAKINGINKSLEALADLDDLIYNVDMLDKMKARIDKDAAKNEKLGVLIANIKKAQKETAAAKAVMDIELPMKPLLTDNTHLAALIKRIRSAQQQIDLHKGMANIVLPEVPVLHDNSKLGVLVNNIRNAQKQIEVYKGLASIKLPEVPVLHDNSRLGELIAKIRSGQAVIAKGNKDLADLALKKKKLEEEIHIMVEKMGGKCPTCGHTLENHND